MGKGTASYLSGFSGLLRRIADRIDPDGAPQITHLSFTFEEGEGIRYREDGKGCPIAYFPEDYERAHEESDASRNARIPMTYKNFDSESAPGRLQFGGHRD